MSTAELTAVSSTDDRFMEVLALAPTLALTDNSASKQPK